MDQILAEMLKTPGLVYQKYIICRHPSNGIILTANSKLVAVTITSSPKTPFSVR